MNTIAYHHAPETVEWETPQAFFDALDAEFHFALDVCATAENAKCERYFTVADDGLAQSWEGNVCWCNPPYGREIGKWLRKAWTETGAEIPTTVVMLIPARTDTAWWHDYAAKGEVRFVRGRIKFSGHKHNAPFPCAVVVFRWRDGS